MNDDSYSFKPDNTFLARLDERTIAINRTLQELNVTLAEVERKIHQIDRDREETKQEMMKDIDHAYVKKSDYVPVKQLVYGFVVFMLLSIGGMFITMVTHSVNNVDKIQSISSSQPIIPGQLKK